MRESLAASDGSPSPGRPSAWQRLLATVLPGVLRHIERLPRASVLRFGERLGILAWNLGKGNGPTRKQRRATLRNLSLAFPDLSLSEREALARRCFVHWSKVTLDFLKAPSYGEAQLKMLVHSIEGFEAYAAPALTSGHGIVAVSAHLGGFEIFGRYMGHLGIPLTVVARAPSDPTLSAHVRHLRESGRYKVIDSYGGPTLRGLLKALRSGEVVGILPDQNGNDLFVPYFGVPAGSSDGAALLAYKTGATLLCAFCALREDNTYEIVVRPPIPVDPSAERTAEILRVTTRIMEEIEWAARRWPEQYLWLHNRFKASFDPAYRDRWPDGYSYEALKARWESA